MRRFKHTLQWLSKRSSFVIAVLFLAIVVLLLWFLNNTHTQTDTSVALSIAAISAFFDASNRGAMYFIIENSGNSPAVNVVFEFTPVPLDFAGRPLNQVSIFQKSTDYTTE